MKQSRSLTENIGFGIGILAFLVLSIFPLCAGVALAFYDGTPTGDMLMDCAAFLLFTGLSLACIRTMYALCFE